MFTPLCSYGGTTDDHCANGKRPRCEKGTWQSDAESLPGFPRWEPLPLELALSLWDAQATAANSQEILQPERAGERAPRLPEP